ncbi:hypothetical protein JCM1393_25070 [Clostridium carnis]
MEKVENKETSIEVVIKTGRRKMYITNTFTGKDVRKEAADIILKNDKT